MRLRHVYCVTKLPMKRSCFYVMVAMDRFIPFAANWKKSLQEPGIALFASILKPSQTQQPRGPQADEGDPGQAAVIKEAPAIRKQGEQDQEGGRSEMSQLRAGFEIQMMGMEVGPAFGKMFGHT